MRITSASRSRLREHLTGRLRCWRSVAVPLVQTALAAGLSWFVAVHLFGHRAPLFAPVAAMVCIDMTVGQRLRRAIELIVGASVGVGAGALNALFANATNLARVPIFLAALLVARGLPALVYKSLTTRRQTLAAALLQATSLSFLVVAGQIGVLLDLLRPAVYAALVAAGLLSELLFPLAALTLLRAEEEEPRDVLEAAVTGRRGAPS
jgi:hypothetical protein